MASFVIFVIVALSTVCTYGNALDVLFVLELRLGWGGAILFRA